MRISVGRAALESLRPLRARYRREMACQVVRDAHHERGFTRLYRIRAGACTAGYGAVGVSRHNRGALQEFYILPRFRHVASVAFRRLLSASRARTIACQSNDPLLAPLLLGFARDVRRGSLLFADAPDPGLPPRGTRFRRRAARDGGRIFAHRREPVGAWVLERAGVVVATGGWLTHYNPPYADLHMEVHPAFRRRGYGSYLVERLKRAARRSGRIPAARCRADNVASRRTLERAGMAVCGRLLAGRAPKLIEKVPAVVLCKEEPMKGNAAPRGRS